MLMCVLSVLLLSVAAQAATQQVNLTITNTTIVVANGGVNTTFNNTPSAQIFQFNTVDCVSTAGNYTANLTTNLDYGLIKQNTQCVVSNLSCPVPTCPQPSCPAPTCPVLDYAQILSAIDTSSEKITGKLMEVNSSISSSNKGMGFKLPKNTLYFVIGILVVAFFTKDKWLPKLKKAAKPQAEKKDDEPQ